jgi:aryl-alcohol dehydrogenase
LNSPLDTTGRNDVITQAVGSLRSMGRCALVGVSAAPKLEIDYAVMNAGRSVEYVFEGDSVPDVFIPKLIALFRNGMLPFDRLIKFYELDNINQAVADSESGATLKAVIRMPH